MTVGDAITAANSICPNEIEDDVKAMWLQNLDGQLILETINHFDDNDESMPTYSSDTDNLLVEEPYTEMYVYFLVAQINFYRSEFERYNANTQMYNEIHDKWADMYQREHTAKMVKNRWY